MFTSVLLLAISSSIDSLGIGITYGIKNMKISFMSKVILFVISCMMSFASLFLGDFLTNIFPNKFSHILGGVILIFIGISVICKSVVDSNNKENTYYDFNKSNLIDPKEAIALGFALSLDSIGIGISYSLGTETTLLFPFFIGSFQIVFLSLGSFLGKKINNISKFPDFICSIFAGVLLILFGLFKLF